MGYTITVFGLGFVGLTTAIGFAEMGYKVYGIDLDTKRANDIKSGILPFEEPFLGEALKRNLGCNFVVQDNILNCVDNSDFIFICVGTPSSENGEADLKYIYNVLDNITPSLVSERYRIVVIKSTIPPGTTSNKIIPYLRSKGLPVGSKFSIANNPEFLREGKCWEDFMYPDRIVCGVCDSKAENMLCQLYSCFDAPFYSVTLNTGEYIKYLSNTLLATMISYSNEMSIIADKIGDITIKDAFHILHMDKRWKNGSMASYVYPGCGYGGYCLPKDTIAMAKVSKNYGYNPQILNSVINVNGHMMDFFENKIKRISINKSTKIGILGLSFKPNSDDVRDSQAAKLISILVSDGYTNINGFDPIAIKPFKQMYQQYPVQYYDSMEELCNISEIIVVVTAWEEFRGIGLKYPEKKVIDGRYL